MAQLRPRTPVASVSDVGALGSAGAGIFADESERSLGAGDARSGLASDGVTLGHLAALRVLGVGHHAASQGHAGVGWASAASAGEHTVPVLLM